MKQYLFVILKQFLTIKKSYFYYDGLAKKLSWLHQMRSQTKEVFSLFVSGAPEQEVQSSFINKGLLRLVKLSPGLTRFFFPPRHGENAKASILEQSAKECVVHQHL